ncbi:MAG: tetratricopeptide repeat protein [Cytophagales bacterium]|nr:MAG: tetratricopeptide repeat protein [Cytophagales bacterium]
MQSRIKILWDYYEQNPNDPFNLYALALEYLKLEQKTEAILFLERLLTEHPTYVPTYYQLGKIYEQNSEDQKKAVEVYEQGILHCKTQGNLKTEQELRNALDELMFDY